MPTISMFFGIVIRMYFAPKEYNPPHIHAYYQSTTASFNITKGTILKGKMPLKQKRMIQAWIEIHKEELNANWTLCQNQETPFPIKPLN